MLQIFGNRWANDPATAGQGGVCLLRGEVVWNGNNSVNLWGRVEQG